MTQQGALKQVYDFNPGYGGPLVRQNIGHVTAVGGVALRTDHGHPIRYVGDDIVIDLPDGRQEIYCGREGRAEAIRDGVLRAS